MVPDRHPFLTFLAWQALGLALLFLHLGLVVLSGNVLLPLGVTATIVGLLYYADALAGFAAFLQILLYQNRSVSLFSTSLSPDLFRASQGTGFALTLALAAIAACRLWLSGRRRNLLLGLGLVGCVIVAYTVLGAARSSPGSAIPYFRSSSIALVGLLIGWDVGRSAGYRSVALCYLVSLGLGLGVALLEVTAPIPYYEWINASRYYSLSLSAASSIVSIEMSRAQDVLTYQTGGFFNIVGGGWQTVRFGGPNMHSVSYAYVLSVAAIVAASLGAYWYVLGIAPLLFLAGVKGAAVLLLWSLSLSLLGCCCGPKVLAASGLALGSTYVGFAIWFGLAAGDYHVIGLIGGVNGFLHNPLGHGIGVGGNLSVDVTRSDLTGQWDLNQRYGADVPLESAIGVMLYQMGVGVVAVAAVIWLAFAAGFRHIWRATNVIPLAIAIVTVNGLLQEEAFSPFAMGLLTIFAGVLSAGFSPQGAEDRRESSRPTTRRANHSQRPAYQLG